MQRRHAQVFILVSSLLCALPFAASASDQLNIHGRISGEGYDQTITGNKTRSFLNPGGQYISDLDLRVNGALNWGTYDASMRGRITSDTRVERRGQEYHVLNSILRLRSAEQLEFYRNRWELDLSQVNEYYTSWSVAQGFLGGRAAYRLDNGLTFKGGGGRVNELEHNSTWDRFTGFGRVEKEDFFGWDLGAHGSRTWDDPRDLAFVSSRPPNAAATMGGFTAKREFFDGKMTFEGENDWSFRKINRFVNGREVGDMASRLELGYQWDLHRLNLHGERVTADYSSLIGFAPQDVLGGRAELSGDPADFFSYRLAYGYQEDNVQNTKITTTKTQTPDVSYTVKPWLKSEFELGRNFRANSGASMFMVEAQNNSINQRNTSYHSGFDDRYQNLSFGVDYRNSFSDNRTLTAPNNDNRDNVIRSYARHEGIMPFLENRRYNVEFSHNYQWTKDIATGFRDGTNQYSLSSFLNLYTNLDWTTSASYTDANRGRALTSGTRGTLDTRLEYRFFVQKMPGKIWGSYRLNDSRNDDKTQNVKETVGRGGVEFTF